MHCLMTLRHIRPCISCIGPNGRHISIFDIVRCERDSALAFGITKRLGLRHHKHQNSRAAEQFVRLSY